MTGQDANPNRLADRYGAPAPWRRRALVGTSAVLALVFIGWLAWTIYEESTPQVTSKLETFEIVDDHTVETVLVVRLRDPEVTASCTLRAYAEDHSAVGEVTFQPDPAKGQRQDVTIRTERRATAVESMGCTAPDQGRPR